ncbi:MAG: hypothetical protein J6P81_07625, partial [Spirochaetales bacterium]|nr:hypothetical protein [Spirochaetales bacterium]
PRVILDSDVDHALKNLDKSIEDGIKFEHILGRNIMLKAGLSVLEDAKERLTSGGTIVLCETLISEASRLSDFIHTGPLQEKLLKAEKEIYSSVPTRKDITEALGKVFGTVKASDYRFTESRSVRESDIKRWVEKSYIPALGKITDSDAQKLEKELVSVLTAAPLMWNTSCLIITLSL